MDRYCGLFTLCTKWIEKYFSGHQASSDDIDDENETVSNESNDESSTEETQDFYITLIKMVAFDKEDDLYKSLDKNIEILMNIYMRKFIIDAMQEEREIKMEEIYSSVCKTARLNSEEFTGFDKQLYCDYASWGDNIEKLKQQVSDKVTSTANSDVPATFPENYNHTDDSKTCMRKLLKITEKGDINEFRIFMNNVKKDNIIFLSKALIGTFPLALKYNQHDILDCVMQELMTLKEIERRLHVLHHACSVNDTDLLEKLYCYYCGNLHWLGTEAVDVKNYEVNIIWNLKLLQIIVCSARTYPHWEQGECNEETMYHLDSLINFNCFQIKLYEKLATSTTEILKKSQDSDNNMEIQIKTLKDIVLNIFEVYKLYTTEQFISLPDCPVDSVYIDNLAREFFLKRIELNVTMILLDNLNLLEERLVMPDGFYKKVKSIIYDFMYHLYNDWSVFKPKVFGYSPEECNYLKKRFNITGGPFGNSVYEMDALKFLISPLIYFKRKEFYYCLNCFKNELDKIDITSHIRDKSNKTSKETHSLNIVPYVTDEVSLERMLYYMDGLSYVDLSKERKNGQLIILRIIQILGEFIKDSEESAHLSSGTKAFLQTVVPSSSMKLLKKIRNNITHVNEAQLLAKIEVEQNDKYIKMFDVVWKELKGIKSGISEFLELHKPRAKKASIKDALIFLQERLDEISNSNNESRNEQKIEENNYFGKMWQTNWSSDNYEEHVRFLERTIETMNLVLEDTTDNLQEFMLSKLSMYIQKIHTALKYIFEIWDQKNEENFDDLNMQWDIIKEILKFIVKDANIFKDDPWKVEQFEYILTLSPSKDNVKHVNNIIEMIIESAEIDGFDRQTIDIEISRNSETMNSGLSELNESLNRSNFLTIREQKAIFSNVSKIIECCETLKDKINKNEPISSKDCDLLVKNLRLKLQSETHLSNLVLGKKRSLNLVECLSDRVSLLKDVLNAHCADDDKQHLIFLKNQKYRLIVEALLFDIMNIFNDTNLKKSLKKTSKFKAGVNLRNMLSHGDPLLELAGDAIDDKDLPVEFMSKALRYARDEDAIKALNTLIRQNVHPKDIENQVDKLKKDQQGLVKEFKKSQYWKEYLVLAFKDEDHKTRGKHQQNSNKTDAKEQSEVTDQTTLPSKSTISNVKSKGIEMPNENELLKAVKAGNLDEVEKIVSTVKAVDVVDASGKASLHYAAMKGREDMIAVLVRGSASVDVRCARDGCRSLHYAAMNGHVAVARALLDAGADVVAVDNLGKTPLHYAVMKARTAVVRALLDAGADVTAVDQDGKTPLDYAKDDAMRSLLGNGYAATD